MTDRTYILRLSFRQEVPVFFGVTQQICLCADTFTTQLRSMHRPIECI